MAAQRLDRFLAAANLSRTRVKSLIEAGHVSIDGATAIDPSHLIRTGQEKGCAKPRHRPFARWASNENPVLVDEGPPTRLPADRRTRRRYQRRGLVVRFDRAKQTDDRRRLPKLNKCIKVNSRTDS
jgi:ribosomal protein S4